MKVARVTIGMLEAKSALAEIDLARNARFNHPLQRPIHRGAAHRRRRRRRAGSGRLLASNQFDEVVGSQVSFLPQEYVDDEIAFAGALAAGGAKAVEIGGRFHGGGTVHRPPLFSLVTDD